MNDELDAIDLVDMVEYDPVLDPELDDMEYEDEDEVSNADEFDAFDAVAIDDLPDEEVYRGPYYVQPADDDEDCEYCDDCDDDDGEVSESTNHYSLSDYYKNAMEVYL